MTKKELAHKCPTLLLDKLAAVAMYQVLYFLTTRNLRLTT